VLLGVPETSPKREIKRRRSIREDTEVSIEKKG
jgi:hypothetical protein